MQTMQILVAGVTPAFVSHNNAIFLIWSACAAKNYCFKNLSTLSISVLRIQIYSSYTQTLHASDKPITNSIRNVHQSKAFLCVHPTRGFHLKVNILAGDAATQKCQKLLMI